jgi:hypothetical protein
LIFEYLYICRDISSKITNLRGTLTWRPMYIYDHTSLNS